MSAAPSQAFRARSSSEIISIPTRLDPKSKQHVVLLMDIQLSFRHVRRIMRSGGDTVVLLTDENLQYLNPPRIAHHPDVVLEVIVTYDNQEYSSSIGVSRNNSHVVGELSGVPGFESEAASVERDVASLSIRETDDNQDLTAGAQDLSLEMAMQLLPTSIARQFLLGTENRLVNPDRLHQFRLQLEALLGRIQQVEQQVDQQAQQTQRQMEEVHSRIQQTGEKIEEVLEKIQQAEQQVEQQAQQTQLQMEDMRGKTQQAHEKIEEIQTSQQQLQGQINTAQQKAKQLDEGLQTLQLQLQRQINAVQQNVKQLDQETKDTRTQIQNDRIQLQKKADKDELCPTAFVAIIISFILSVLIANNNT
ncbi:hypothetical protein BGX34_000120 [Mortierella sp. NVP85]|nr:hypothetical protein BGX34_000120 [Mortierella sp. NVP85]